MAWAGLAAARAASFALGPTRSLPRPAAALSRRALAAPPPPPVLDIMDRATARLAALQRHLAASSDGGMPRGEGWAAAPRRRRPPTPLLPPPGALAIVPTSSAVPPAASGGPGALTIVDSRTGARYEVPIHEGGYIKATDLKKIVAGGDGVGLRTYDPG